MLHEPSSNPFDRCFAMAASLFLAVSLLGGCTVYQPVVGGSAHGSVYYPDPGQPDQGAPTGHASRTICDIVKSVGARTATIYLRHTGKADTTSYLFDTSLSLADDANTTAGFASYANIYLQIEPGAQLVRKTGDEVLKVSSPENLIASPRQRIANTDMLAFKQGGIIYPQWWGALGNNIQNDSPAIQCAINCSKSSNSTVQLLPGRYRISETIKITGPYQIEGSGKNTTYLITDANIPIINIDSSMQWIFYSQIRNLCFIGEGKGDRTSNSGILITGTPENAMAYNAFKDLLFTGTYYGIRVAKVGVDNGEARFDWNNFTGITTTNHQYNNVEYGILFENGSGTGNVFSSSNLVVNTSGIEFRGSDGRNVGDIVINAIEFGGGGSAIKGLPTAAYRNNISVTGCQFDGGIKLGLDFENYSHLHLAGNLWGGATTNRLINCSFMSGGLSETQSTINYGKIQDVRTGNSIDMFKLELFADYSGVYVEVVTEGLLQGIGAAITTSRYQLSRNTSGEIEVERIESVEGKSKGRIVHETAINGNTVTFKTKVNATMAHSNLRTSARIVGAYARIVE